MTSHAAAQTEAVPGSHPDWQSRFGRGKAQQARAPAEELRGGLAALTACSNSIGSSGRAPAHRVVR